MRGPVCRAPPVSQPGLPLPARPRGGVLSPPSGSGKPGLFGAELPAWLWCNLLAEPLPELRVPLGVGQLSSSTSPACLGASQNSGHTPWRCGLTHRKYRLGGRPWERCHAGRPALHWWPANPAAPRTLARLPALPSDSPRIIAWTWGPAATAMFGRKRSVSFGGFGWWVTGWGWWEGWG